MRDQSIKGRLEEAFEIAKYPGDAYVAASHDFACHYDGSSDFCGSETLPCAPDRENLAMLDLAREVVEHGGDIEELKLAWAQRMVTS